MNSEALLAAIASVAQRGDLGYTQHFYERLNDPTRPDQGDVVGIICDHESLVIERFDVERRGPLLLVCGRVNGRIGHVLVTFPPDPEVVTAYWPDMRPQEWSNNYRRRLR